MNIEAEVQATQPAHTGNRPVKKLMLGNQAIARGAYEAGAKVVSSYPGTPSTEITEYAALYPEIFCEWAPNEKVALEVCIGAAIAGSRAMSAMKHVGLNVAADPLFTVSYTGINAGLVICVADDPGLHSSQNEQDSRHYARAAKIPMLEPSDSAECKDFVRQAFELSEQYDTPVLVRLSTRVSHSQSLVEQLERCEEKVCPYEKNIPKYVMMPAMAKVRHNVVEDRIKKMEQLAETSPLNRAEIIDGQNEANQPKIGVITSGVAYEYTKEALPDASVLKLGMVYPLPVQLILDFASKVDVLYVVEELDSFIETHCKALGLSVRGKDILPLTSEYSAELIKEKITGVKSQSVSPAEQLPVRPPVMCPGCPHRGVHYVLNKMGLTVTGDIGCYTLGAMPPLNTMDTCICMGASVSMAHGFTLSGIKKTVGIIGDSTFIHSGITGLIDIVYNNGNATIIILDNSITGMTGHQHNPCTGKTIKGEAAPMVDLYKLCQAVGVNNIVVADPFDLKNFEKVVARQIAIDQPSVIIAQRPCALLKEDKGKSFKYEGKAVINQDKCKNCKLCLKPGCPALSLNGKKIEVDSALCNGCGLCKNICAFKAIEESGV